MSSTAREYSAFRRVGYRLLPGEGFSYFLHLRPAEWPIMSAHTALGAILAIGLPQLLRGQGVWTLVEAVLIWVVFLNGGTLAINSVFDKDEGDIGYLRAPPVPPRHLLVFSLGLMIVGQVLALRLPAGFAIAYAVCFAMSVAYSVPPLRFKAVAGVDWIINMWGFGFLTPYAGWAATGRPLDVADGLALFGFCPLFAAFYPLTQLYQFDEDRRRGDRTLALILGMRRSLQVAIGATLVAFACFFGATALAPAAPWWAAPGIGVALFAWLWVLLPWYRHRDRWTMADHQRGFYAALVAWAITDVAILLGFALPS